MPPLQRTVDAPALVTDPAGFRGSLGTWRDASFLGPLGHLMSPQAPSGLGHGLVVPSASAEVPAVSREVSSAARGAVAAKSGMRLPVVPLQRAVDGGGFFGPPTPHDASGGVTVETSAPLVSAAPPDMPLRQLARVPVEGPRPGVRTDGPPAPSAPASASPPVQRAVEPGSARPHGFGLGEPLAELPPTAQRRPAASTSGPLAPDEPGAALPDPPSRPLLADDPLVVRTADTGPVREPEPAVTATTTPVRIQRATAAGTPVAAEPAPAAGPVVPLVAQRQVPLFSRVPPPGAEDAPEVRGGEAEVRVVPLRWSSGTDDGPAATAGADPARAEGTPSRSAPVPSAQRTVAPPAAPWPMAAREPSRPWPRTAREPSPPGSGLVQDAGAVAVAAGVAQRRADGSVVFHPPSVSSARPAPPYGPRPASVPLPPAVQRMPSAPSSGVVQRDVTGSEPPPPDPPGPSAPSAEPSPEPLPESSGAASSVARERPGEQAHGAASGGSGQGAPNVDDALVRALFAPLSRLLKAELRLDRERAGHLIDTRH
ncbi:hypothetical protein [Streptomyces olivaceoviridis]|uniref:hypothetical protein n=1 Tax=Streptomyces olivaceoviridis TaxID=1921 RepID=UPI0036FABD33